MSKILLGAIADDFTGATDLASTLVAGGMRTLLMLDVPQQAFDYDQVDAIVIALKTRTMPVEDAVSDSLEALKWLQQQDCQQYFFKYCSTFDSTSEGNIGPVADALKEELDAGITVISPAFPVNHRTVYQGHLFVADQLLSESSMRHHPLTPMMDSNLLRLMSTQTSKKIGLLPCSVMSAGVQQIRQELESLASDGVEYAVIDAVNDEQLKHLGHAANDHLLLTGSSSAALGLPDNYAASGVLNDIGSAANLPIVGGFQAVLSGSCSKATNQQVEHWKSSRPSFKLDPLLINEGVQQVDQALQWAQGLIEKQAVLIYATSSPDDVKKIQAKLGVEKAGLIIEEALSSIALGLRDLGVKQFVVAGGETSGAVVKALQVKSLRIGNVIDPGVPWTVSVGEEVIALALKSGNFGSADFFEKSLTQIQ